MVTLLENLRTLYQKKSKLFKNTDIQFVPVVNPDSYIKINQSWNTPQWLQIKFVRKNRNPGNGKCPIEKQGVDLNRNYGYRFMYMKHKGGRNNPCSEAYRGIKAFSEPETQGIKSLIEKQPEIRSAMNFHAWGDLLITPYSYTLDKTNQELRNQPKFYKVYKDFANAPHQSKAKFGNAEQVINYVANGEAADWMLHTHDIIAFSPEVGDDSKISEHFYVQNPEYIPTLMKNFYPTVRYFVHMHNTN